MSSGETRPDKSGSSPYQNIQSSLAADSDRGGGAGEGAIPMSNIAPVPVAAGVAATRRHTQSMSLARHREKLDNTGSSRGVPTDPPAISPHTNFRHFIPHRSV